MADLYSLLTADEPSAAEKAQALASALRRQQQVGILGQLTGDKVLSKVGSGLVDSAAQQQEQLAQVPQLRLRQALEQQRFAAGQQEAADTAALHDPNSTGTVLLRSLGQKFAPGMVPQGATGADLKPVMPLLEQYASRVDSAKERALLRRSLGGGSGSGGGPPVGLSPEALDQMAEMFARTGTLPPLGQGKQAGAVKQAIVNRAAELHPDGDLAGNKAGYGADSKSLQKLQAQADAVDAFEKTALKNVDTFLGTAKSIPDFAPFINKPARELDRLFAGDPNMAKFNAARQTAVQEIAKVLGGANGGTVSDSARHEAESLLSPDASVAQIEAAVNILKQDMANRKQAIAEQLADIRGRTSGKAAKSEGSPAASTAHPQDSAAVQWAKAHPGDPRAAAILKANGGAP